MCQLMIVDDDVIIRRGLSLSIPWEEYGIRIMGVAGDGEAALKIMEENEPDIVIADIRMPRVDGLKFAEIARSRYPGIKVILLTAYKDFEYAKTALRLSVFDYLLKPVDNQAVLEVVNRAALAKGEQEKIDRKLKESTPLLLQQFLMGLIEERYSPNEIHTKIEFLGIKNLKAPLAVMVIKVDDYYRWNGRTQKDTLKHEIVRIIEGLDKDGRGLPVDSEQDEIVLLYPANSGASSDILSEVRYFAERVIQEVQQRLQTTVTIGVGKACGDLSETGRSYLEACSALEIRHITGGNQIYFGRELPTETENSTVDIYPMARELVQQLKLGLLEESLTVVAQIEKEILEERLVTLERLRLIGLEIAVLLFAEVKEWSEIGNQISKKYDVYQFTLNLNQSQTTTEIFGKLRRLITEICTAVNLFRKSMHHTLIQQALDYITANFGKTELSLQDVAAQIHLSPTYLSNIFKKEQGINFFDFILELRMNKAKKLLRDGTLKVYEVAQLVGYNNVHYFSASFKKYTGISPTDFKNI